MNKTYDLEDRMIDFSVSVMNLANYIKRNQSGMTLRKQIVRSGTSISLNYSEALSAESKKDFVHKIHLSLKELRETLTCLRLLYRGALFEKASNYSSVYDECQQLISILSKTIFTTKKRYLN